MSSSSCNSNHHEYADVDWDSLGFGLMPTDYMYTMKCGAGDELNHKLYKDGKISPYGNIELSPAAAVLNYGQGLFEGLKAYRKETGEILLFRPNENALRMQFGAERMCMPAPSEYQFVDAVKQIVVANQWRMLSR